MKDSDSAQQGGERSELGDTFGAGTAFIPIDRRDTDMNLLQHGRRLLRVTVQW
jgi:hypothetical protein